MDQRLELTTNLYSSRTTTPLLASKQSFAMIITMKKINIDDYISKVFQLTKRSYWTIFFNTIIYTCLMFLAIITLIGIFALPALTVGYCTFLLKAARKEELVLGDSLSEGFKNDMWWKSLLISLVIIIGCLLGTILLIIPGIYLMTVWSFGFYLLVDKNMKPLEALEKSREIVHQAGFWNIFVLLLLLPFALGLPTYIPVIGWIWYLISFPFITMIGAIVYTNVNDIVSTK